MPFFDFQNLLAERLAAFLSHPELTRAYLFREFSTPPQTQLGYVALPCFKLAKLKGISVQELTILISKNFSAPGISSSAMGPYVNFKFDLKQLYSQTVGAVLRERERYGTDTVGTGKSVVIEYCSPNIARRLAFQHIRSTLIGNALANAYRSLGYQTIRVNFIGDWGAQFARLLAAVELWGDPKCIERNSMEDATSYLLQLYVRFHKELENHPELAERASHCLARLERQDGELIRLWKQIREITIRSMTKTLARMGISFDHTDGESLYVPKIEQTLENIKRQAQARLSEGAWIVDVDGLNTPALIQKRDGTTLYLTRDIAAAVDRNERFHFDRMLYVVAEQQRLHFQQLFGVLAKMGYVWANTCSHVSFGTVLFGAEKMSTREGNVVFLDDVLDQAKRLAKEQCLKNAELIHPDQVAEEVGIGAIVFGELSASRQRDIEFDFKRVLALDGETGPYVQYALVRCRSLLDKAHEPIKSIECIEEFTFAPEEEVLILELSKFRSVLHKVVHENEPHHLARYLIDMARALNRFYYQLPVLQAASSIQKAVRLTLVQATELCLANGLRILSVPCPVEM